MSNMKEIWYEHVIKNKALWCHGFTLKRLEKVKPFVFAEKAIMEDLLLRHGGNTMKPDEMKIKNKEWYEHGINNFVCNILYKMMDQGIIKSKK